MNCVDEVNDLVIKAQNDIIAHTGSYDSWDDRVTNAIAQCSALGIDVYRNDLVLKVRYQLKNVGSEAGGPQVLSLDKIKTRKVPAPKPSNYLDVIPW